RVCKFRRIRAPAGTGVDSRRTRWHACDKYRKGVDAPRAGVGLRGYLVGQRGAESSMRQIGPWTKNGPSNFTNAGGEPPRTQNFRSGGSFPATFANTPATPPTSRSTR